MNAFHALNDLKKCLKSAFTEESLTDFSLEIVGNSAKGDGYLGDILFVDLTTKRKTYQLVLKCSKKSEKLRETLPVQNVFKNEIFLYTKVFPAFNKFQEDKGVDIIFSSVPKCFGKFIDSHMEILILENLRSLGYTLHDRKKPLSRNYINLVVGEYGKWHALSAALQDQQPEYFQQLASKTQNLWVQFGKSMDLFKLFEGSIDENLKLIENDISKEAKTKIIDLKSEVIFTLEELISDRRFFSVITHGDCWNNNFMFKLNSSEEPEKVAFLDWQISKLGSPVTDLAYFIYACISGKDLEDFDEILKLYYESFANSVRKLGSDPETLYPFLQLLADWKLLAKFGLLLTFHVVKVASSDQDEVQDIVETIEKGFDMSQTFLYESKNTMLYKDKLVSIVNHFVERGFI